MPIPVTCPKCGRQASAPDEAAGKKVRCKCGEALVIAPPKKEGSSSTDKTLTDPIGNAKDSKGKSRKGNENSRTSSESRSGSSKASAPQAVSPGPTTSSLLDLLTTQDQELAQKNPYAVTEKSGTSDAAALRTYLKDDEEKKNKEKQSQGNLLAITVCFFLGVIKNIAVMVIALAFAKELPQAVFGFPFIPVGAVYLAVLVPYALVDLGIGVGMAMKQSWGWWLAVVGLGWAIMERIAALAVACLTSDEINGPLFAGGASLVLCIVSFALIHFLLTKENQKKFKVDVKPMIGWLIALLVPLVIEGTITGVFYVLLKNAMANPAA